MGGGDKLVVSLLSTGLPSRGDSAVWYTLVYPACASIPFCICMCESYAIKRMFIICCDTRMFECGIWIFIALKMLRAIFAVYNVILSIMYVYIYDPLCPQTGMNTVTMTYVY